MRRWKAILITLPALAAAGWWGVPWLVPLPEALLKPATSSTRYLARDGTPLRHLLDENGHRSAPPVTFAEIPQPLVHALLAAEDKRFFSHGGIDLFAIARAVRDNARSGRVVSGASTVHQQLIKNTTPGTGKRTLWVKLVEALRARHLAMSWSHDEVFAAYVNRISFGNLMTGAATAASGYFHKPLGDLTPAECALLAALPQSPARLNPFRNLNAVLPRQRRILDQMHALGWLSDEQHRVALDQSIVLQRFSGGFEAPHAVEMLRGEARSSTIRTTLDATLQQHVETIIAQRLEALKGRHVSHGAVVVIENATGAVLALAGSRDFFASDGGQLNGAWAPHSPGSAMKPFTYEIAFERGAMPASIVADLPIEFTTTTSGTYRPENYSLRSYGPMTYRNALGNSLNISAVRVLDSIGGAETLLPRLRELGLTTLTEDAAHYGLGLTIGNASVRLIELANAYACLARLGRFKPWTLRAEAPAVEERRLLGENESWLVADILSDNQAREMSFGSHSVLRLPFKCAVKTGTSSTFRDNWTLGYTPEFTVGVWVGNFDNTPMQDVSGVTGAGPIFRDVMLHLHEKHPATWFERPAAVTHARIDPRTGRRLTPQTPPARVSREEYFVGGKMPPIAQAADYDTRGRAILPREYAEWVRSSANWLGDLVTTAETDARPMLRITHPIPGTVVILDPDIRNHGNRLLLQSAGAMEPHWSSKTIELRKEADHTFAILKPGRHEIEVHDEASGLSAKTFVIVQEE
ncbi:MAG: penicillin-binding protein 1C [Prosthecobacter sp.]|jgi:penicillin-binding protein 1C|uniref:penicillin-binding protein 1C n=1 Tax=Prosthecobacter sp. TaxID=1965333 RepID=UPI001A008C93|nr:penicillin-binding protein 1C [Prosthecobacter sp.]MBE2284737.1 penicillin-binding protein 1C [Prosthecobacter sp.]